MIVESIPLIMTTMSTIKSAMFALSHYLGCGSSLPLPTRLQFDNQPAVKKLLEISKRGSPLGLSGLCIAGGMKIRSNGALVDCQITPAKMMATMSTINSVTFRLDVALLRLGRRFSLGLLLTT